MSACSYVSPFVSHAGEDIVARTIEDAVECDNLVTGKTLLEHVHNGDSSPDRRSVPECYTVFFSQCHKFPVRKCYRPFIGSDDMLLVRKCRFDVPETGFPGNRIGRRDFDQYIIGRFF